MTDTDRQFLTIQEAAVIIGKSERTLYRYIRKNKLKCQRLSDKNKNMTVIDRQEFSRFIKELGFSSDKLTDTMSDTVRQPLTNNDNLSDTVRHEPEPEKPQGKELLTPDNIRAIIEDVLGNRELQLTRPMEDQALFKLGEANQLIKTLRDELRRQDDTIKQIEGQLKLLPAPPEIIASQIESIEQERDTLKISLQIAQEGQDEVQKALQALSDQKEQTDTLKRKLEEEHKATLDILEEEKRAREALTRQIEDERNRSWWSRLFRRK